MLRYCAQIAVAVLIFFLLPADLVFLAISIDRLANGEVGTGANLQFASAITGLVILGLALGWAVRKPKEDRILIAANPAMQQFATRLRKLRIYEFCLLLVSGGVLAFWLKVAPADPWGVILAVTILLGGYFPARSLWLRCPSCGYRFFHDRKPSSSIDRCPGCGVRLQ